MSNRASLIVHAMRGPILLITIGILAALHQAGIASITHTWPMLIIVLGVIKLVERILAPRVPFLAPPYPYVAGQPSGQYYAQGAYAQPPYGQAPPPPTGGTRP